MNKIVLLLLLYLVGCQKNEDRLTSIQVIDRNGFNETISNPDRLSKFEHTDFAEPQPYTKVMRMFGNQTALVTSYHDSGSLWQKLQIVRGRAHGPYEEFHPNGKLKVEAFVIEGVGDVTREAQRSWIFDGMTRAFDEKGRLLAEIYYERGLLEKETVYYHPSGEIRQIISYANGVPHGPSKSYDAEGALISEALFTKGYLLEGDYPDSQIRNGTGIQSVYNEDNLVKQVQFQSGVPQGTVKLFAEGKISSEYQIKDGKKHGDELLYYPDGKQKMLIVWRLDEAHGLAKTWYESGALLSEKEMYRNLRHGRSCAYYPDGQVMMIEQYERNQLISGKYYPMGSKTTVSEVRNGNGIATIYDDAGVLLRRVHYEKGKPIEE